MFTRHIIHFFWICSDQNGFSTTSVANRWRYLQVFLFLLLFLFYLQVCWGGSFIEDYTLIFIMSFISTKELCALTSNNTAVLNITVHYCIEHYITLEAARSTDSCLHARRYEYLKLISLGGGYT